MEGTGKGWAESGLQAGQLSLFLTSPRPGRAGEPGTRHVLRGDKLSLSHCPVARAVLVAGMHSPVCVTSWGSCWPPPLGFPTPSLTFWLGMVVLPIGGIMLVSGPSSKSPAWDLDFQSRLSDDLY